MSCAADGSARQTIPDRDQEVGLLDHDAAGERYAQRGFCREDGRLTHVIAGVQRREEQTGDEFVAIREFEQPCLRCKLTDAHGAVAHCDAAGGKAAIGAGEQSVHIVYRRRTRVDGDVERESEG